MLVAVNLYDTATRRDDSLKSMKPKYLLQPKSWVSLAVGTFAGFFQPEIWAETIQEEVIVSGKRTALATVQEIKRDKMEIVDSVIADDIGKLPDINVTDAMSRVTGVQILRDRGEGAGVAIRGLTQMETLFNGREIFTAGAGRNLDFADIPSEMLAGIDVYKTSSAGLIEGGVGGTVDLRTRRPFDFSGLQGAASARVIHGDLVDDQQPQFSSLLSNRWQSENFGEFGALLNVAYQRRAWREDQKSSGNPIARNNLIAGQSVVVPNGAIDTVTRGLRERIGGSMILQWRPSDRWDLYAEAHHAQFKTWQDGYQLFLNPSASFAANNVSLFPGTGDVQNLTWSNPTVSNWGSARDTLDRTSQLALGGSWNRDALTLKTDLSYTESHNNLFYSVITRDGSAGSLTQNVASLNNTLTDVSFNKAGMVYASRPFDGGLWAWQADGEYRFTDSFFDALSAGVRFAQRNATDAPGQVTVYQPAAVAIANASALSIASAYSDYLVGNPQTARDVQAVRNTLGLASALPTSNPLGTWTIQEDTRSGYLMARFNGAVDGNFGVRVVATQDQVSGYQSVPASTGTAPLGLDHAYIDALPSMNVRYELAKGLFLRGAASKSVTRPDFNQLSPSLTLNSAQRNGAAGNPALQPIRSDNFDIAVERYFNPTTSVSLTGFFKQVEGFVTTVSNPELHDGLIYQVSRPQSGNNAEIKGFEAGYQQFYDFLPSWLNGLGLQANYTYIESATPSSILGQNVPLQNLSKHSYNLIGLYERGPLSARIAYNWRDTFLSGIGNFVGVGALPIYTQAYGWLDASLGYKVDEHLSLALEGTNLLGTRRVSYFGVETRPQSSWINDVQVGASVTVHF